MPIVTVLKILIIKTLLTDNIFLSVNRVLYIDTITKIKHIKKYIYI